MEILNPYQDLTGGTWLCGNLHSHTTHSDGKRPRQEVVDDYAARGHGFLMLSDHDVFTGPDDIATLNTHGMVLIPGNEITAQGAHMLHVNADRRIEPYADRQQAINEAVAAGGFIVLNHPNWRDYFNHIPVEQMMQFTGYTGVEIYNGGIGKLQGSPYAVDKWDQVLTHGHRVWGFANDDSHGPTTDCGLGWNCVYTRDKTAAGIAAAMQKGCFYASTGVKVTSVQVKDNRIRITTENAERIVAIKQWAVRITHSDSNELEVEIPANARYVRFDCWGHGESFAWTQPIFIDR